MFQNHDKDYPGMPNARKTKLSVLYAFSNNIYFTVTYKEINVSMLLLRKMQSWNWKASREIVLLMLLYRVDVEDWKDLV